MFGQSYWTDSLIGGAMIQVLKRKFNRLAPVLSVRWIRRLGGSRTPRATHVTRIIEQAMIGRDEPVWHSCAGLSHELDEQCVRGQRRLAPHMLLKEFCPHARLREGVQTAVDYGSIRIDQQHILVLPIRESVAFVLA